MVAIWPIDCRQKVVIGDYNGKGGVITGIITPAQAVETPDRAPEGRRPEGARSGVETA